MGFPSGSLGTRNWDLPDIKDRQENFGRYADNPSAIRPNAAG